MQSTAGNVAVSSLIPTMRLSEEEQAQFFLSGYSIPTDAAGWLRAFAVLGSAMRSPICLSDMMLPGNPLIFVNRAWCEATGYLREEVLGRNCRFLQGPDTEAGAVQEMVDALRDGRDACVRITNYRKDGEAFENLVTLRPVLDTNGVYRFCMCLSLVVSGAHAPRMPMSVPRLKLAAAELASLRNVVRSWVPYAVGKVHRRTEITQEMLENNHDEEASDLLREALERHFLLHVLNDTCKEALVSAFRPKSVLPGQYLIKRGSPPDAVYVLRSGRCSVSDGTEFVTTLGAGEVFGELAILQGTARSASIVTSTACELYVVPEQHFAYILGRYDPRKDLRAVCAAYMHKQEQLHEIEHTIFDLTQGALATAAQHKERHAPASSEKRNQLFAGNHANMREALGVIVAEQQVGLDAKPPSPGEASVPYCLCSRLAY